ncbi:MAG: hypothetical protein GY845_25730 [Planctomycetes bacterium]|nr:hypothetical protein [Planctomycetota bacterium]
MCDATLIINQVYLNNLKRECSDWTDEELNELLTGVKVMTGLERDLNYGKTI